jgi:hypothetical protein
VANPNGAKGAAHERAVRSYLEEVFGRAVRRPRAEGFKDVGDIHLSPFVLQAKNWADTTSALNEGVRGAEVQVVHAAEAFGVAVIKKRGSNIAEARVAMTLRTFRDLAARLLSAEEHLRRTDPYAYGLHIDSLKDTP